MSLTRLILCLLLIFTFCSLVSAEPVKQPSKIGIHLLSSYSTGVKILIRSNLPIIKVLDLTPDMRKAVVNYKKLHPQGTVVLRVYTHFNDPNREKSPLAMPYRITDDPEVCARDYWETKIIPQLKQATSEELKLIDYVEGPNEGSDCPTWTTLEDVKWFTRFWLTLSPLIHKAGFKPCIGSIAVGNPPGSPEEIKAKLETFAPALRQARKFGGAWSYHSYTLEYTKDPGVEHWYSLRYHQFYDVFKKHMPDLADMPMILTEGGVDKAGNRLTDGWQERGTVEKYIDWIRWFDGEIARDPYVIGVTLFAIGDDWWKSFNLEPMAKELAEYLGKK